MPIDFEKNPLVPAVIQDDESRDVLMVGFMNQLAFEQTLETGFVHFWSRSRNQLWKKGETSGHTQEVVSMAINCEDNSLLIQVIQNGAVCHTGHRTCYYRQILPDGSLVETSDPVFDPAEVYERMPPAEVARAESRKRAAAGCEPGSSVRGSVRTNILARQPLQDGVGNLEAAARQCLAVRPDRRRTGRAAGRAGGRAHATPTTWNRTSFWKGVRCSTGSTCSRSAWDMTWDRDLALDDVLSTRTSLFDATESEATSASSSAKRWPPGETAEARLEAEQSDFKEELFEQLTQSYRLVSRAVAPIVTPNAPDRARPG